MGFFWGAQGLQKWVKLSFKVSLKGFCLQVQVPPRQSISPTAPATSEFLCWSQPWCDVVSRGGGGPTVIKARGVFLAPPSPPPKIPSSVCGKDEGGGVPSSPSSRLE